MCCSISFPSPFLLIQFFQSWILKTKDLLKKKDFEKITKIIQTENYASPQQNKTASFSHKHIIQYILKTFSPLSKGTGMHLKKLQSILLRIDMFFFHLLILIFIPLKRKKAKKQNIYIKKEMFCLVDRLSFYHLVCYP